MASLRRWGVVDSDRVNCCIWCGLVARASERVACLAANGTSFEAMVGEVVVVVARWEEVVVASQLLRLCTFLESFGQSRLRCCQFPEEQV